VVISESPVRAKVRRTGAARRRVRNSRFCRGLWQSLRRLRTWRNEYLAKLYRSESVAWQKTFLERGGRGRGNRPTAGCRSFQAHWRADDAVCRAAQRGEALLDFGLSDRRIRIGSDARWDLFRMALSYRRTMAHKAHSAWGAPEHGSIGPRCRPIRLPGRKFHYVTAFETLETFARSTRLPEAVARIDRRRWPARAFSVPSTHYFWLKFQDRPRRFARASLAAAYAARAGARRCTRVRFWPHTHLYNFSPRAVDLLLRQAGFPERGRGKRLAGGGALGTALPRVQR